MNLETLVEPDRVHKTVYTDPQIFDREMELIWERTWVYCGHESQVPEPLYDEEDVHTTLALLRPQLEFGQTLTLGSLTARAERAGHILGSAFLVLTAGGERIVFSGDLGNRESGLQQDFTLPPEADAALRQAEERCAGLPGVTFANMVLPGAWPDGGFDLVIFSEVLYYLGIPGLQDSARRTMDCLQPGGAVVLVNWRGPTDGACTGEEAADLFTAACAPGLRTTKLVRAEKYRLDVLQLG